MTEAICNYWIFNINSSSSGTQWDVFKAWVWGKYISRIASLQREEAKALGDLEADAEKREREYVDSPTEVNYYAWQQVLRELSLCRIEQKKKSMLHSAQRVFEHGDKNGQLLVWLAKGQTSSTHIAGVRDEGGHMITSPEGINTEFSQFYQGVYSSRAQYSPSELQEYLGGITFPTLEEDSRNNLEKDIYLEEVQAAIAGL